MKLIDLNRDGGIGANCLYLQLGEFRVLVDCGLHPKQIGRRATPDFSPLQGEDLDLILVTHCHLDHIGSLPLAMRAHPRAPVLMSRPSAALVERMLHNSASVMKRQREEANIPEYPLFTHEEIERIAPRFVGLPYKSLKRFSGDREELGIVFHSAGHIAGAAGVELLHEGKRYFITGDVLFEPQLTLPGAELPEGHFDVLITETTRGDTHRPEGKSRLSEISRLIDTINRVVGGGGSFLIPVFALGRMQELLAVLHQARRNNQLVDAPIYAAGLGLDLADYFDEITRKTGLIHFTRSILRDLKLKPPPDSAAPGRPPKGRGIHVLSSGMLVERTPSYGMAAALLGHSKSAIGYIGYCDPDTPGGKMLAALPGDTFVFETLDYETEVRAEIHRFEMSGHADRDQLLDYALGATPKSIVLTHGDPPARAWFEESFAEKAPEIQVVNPVPLQPYDI